MNAAPPIHKEEAIAVWLQAQPPVSLKLYGLTRHSVFHKNINSFLAQGRPGLKAAAFLLMAALASPAQSLA
jgi:hypothetical protein